MINFKIRQIKTNSRKKKRKNESNPSSSGKRDRSLWYVVRGVAPRGISRVFTRPLYSSSERVEPRGIDDWPGFNNITLKQYRLLFSWPLPRPLPPPLPLPLLPPLPLPLPLPRLADTRLSSRLKDNPDVDENAALTWWAIAFADWATCKIKKKTRF